MFFCTSSISEVTYGLIHFLTRVFLLLFLSPLLLFFFRPIDQSVEASFRIAYRQFSCPAVRT